MCHKPICVHTGSSALTLSEERTQGFLGVATCNRAGEGEEEFARADGGGDI